MIGGTTPLSNVLGAAPPADAELPRLRMFAKTAAAQGLHLLLIEPGGKTPVDMRSSVRKRTDDTAAQQLAREAGRPDWDKVRSKKGVHLATADDKSLSRYLEQYRKIYGETTAVNFAVAVGPSRLVVVDCDTEEQVSAFLSDAGIPSDAPLPPTVRSPGQRDADGNWVHYGGGHFYFTLPDDVELPAGSGSVAMPGGYVILWDGRYVLIPPSVRAEGTYYLAGQDYPVPKWILDRIQEHAAGRTDRRVRLGDDAGELASNIDAWSEMVSWDDLLEPAGWTMAARPDGCGCPVWTAPGVHASPKSATAHDTGCSYGRYSAVNAPLHIWTDNPGDELAAWISSHGAQTVTKLQFAAVTSYGGDVGTACAQIGLIPKDDLSLDTDDMARDLGLSGSNLDEPLSAGYDVSDLQGPMPYAAKHLTPAAAEYGNAHRALGSGRVTFETLKSPVVDAARERAKAAVADPPPFGTPYGEPIRIPVHLGDVWRDEYEDMLIAEGFNLFGPHVPGTDKYRSTNPDDDRELTITYDRSTMVIAEMTINGEHHSHISLTPLRSSLPVSAQPVPERTPVPETNTVSSVPDSPDEESGDDAGPPISDPPEFTDAGGEFEDGVLEPGDQFMPRIALFDYWRDYPAPEFVVDGILERGGMTAIIGPAGKGKTAVALDMISCIATGQRWHGRATQQQRGLYLPGEGMSGAIQRLKAWEDAHKSSVGTALAIGEGILRAGAPKAAWERLVQIILQNHIGLLVFDTWARMAVGIEENSATDVGKVIARLDEVRKLTGVTVLILHHTTKGTSAGRGSSALNGALDTEILVTDDLWSDDEDSPPPGKQLTVRITKQKNAAEVTDGIPLLMVPHGDSIVITGPSGEVGDVFDEIGVTRAIMPEPTMETSVRLANELRHFTAQGLTIPEAMQAVPMDEWTARRGDANKAWKLAMRRAVDLGLKYELFETLSGSASGSRYILSETMTISSFREQVIAAGLSE